MIIILFQKHKILVSKYTAPCVTPGYSNYKYLLMKFPTFPNVFPVFQDNIFKCPDLLDLTFKELNVRQKTLTSILIIKTVECW